MNWRPAMWIPVALAVAHFGDRPGRRAALRGALSIAATAGIGHTVDALSDVGRGRRLRPRVPVGSTAQPVIASAIAFTAATALETPRLAIPVGAVAAPTIAWAVRHSNDGRRDLAGATLLGAAAALAMVKVWPRTPPAMGAPAATPAMSTDAVSPTGAGLTIVVNSAAGDPTHDESIAEIEAGLPDVTVHRIDDVERLEDELAEVAESSTAIGALGGDGTVGATARAALDADIPLAVFPGGTLNHFARDAGVDTIADAIRAVQSSRLIQIDTGLIDGHTFVNTASLGSYSKLVELREEHEETIGKWPAVVLALVRMLADSEPFALTIDGARRRIWMIFVGNCSYEPAGFAPTYRPQLDDGLFDIRIIDADQPFARSRLIVALLTGRLARSAVYSRELAERIDIDSDPDGTDSENELLAADGEIFPSRESTFTITKNPRPLRLFVAAAD